MAAPPTGTRQSSSVVSAASDGKQAEEGQGPVEAARRQDGVAVLDQHDGIGSRSPARDGAQGPRQRVTLARRFAAHQDQPHARRRRQPPEQVLGQPLVGHLDHGGHDRHRAWGSVPPPRSRR